MYNDHLYLNGKFARFYKIIVVDLCVFKGVLAHRMLVCKIPAVVSED